MPDNKVKVKVEVKPLVKRLGKGFELHVLALKPKNGNVAWVARVAQAMGKDKCKEDIAAFNKPLERSKYLVSIQGRAFPINDNGVQATYQDWRRAVERLIESKITWRPTGRGMFRLNM